MLSEVGVVFVFFLEQGSMDANAVRKSRRYRPLSRKFVKGMLRNRAQKRERDIRLGLLGLK